MDCSHQPSQRPEPLSDGAEATCQNCEIPLIYRRGKWLWLFGLSQHERNGLRTEYRLKEIFGG